MIFYSKSGLDIDDIIKIVKSLEDLDALTDWVTEAVKHEIKKQKCRILGALLRPLAASVVQLGI